MLEPRFMKEGYDYIGANEKWHIKESAPEWAKLEFIEFFKMLKGTPDKDGVVTKY